jgi:aryl-alcohol dehydrogenase-like predicted oxidoreductase
MQYVLLGQSGLRVSELCLGAMTFGDPRPFGTPLDDARQIFDAFTAAGGNFIDTASYYGQGASEETVGRLTEADRDRYVIATKYSLSLRRDDPNAGGNHRKSLVRSLEASLRRLRTDYVDVLWVHAWDFLTPVDEVVRALDDVVRAGKALYVGVSDTPAWRVAEMNTLARLRGWTPFVGLQVQYNLAERTAERDLLPMAAAHGLAVTAWSPLAAGLLTGKYTARRAEGLDERRGTAGMVRLTPQNAAAAEALDSVAAEVGRPPSQVALAWLRDRSAATGAEVIPIVGARTPTQMADNLGAVGLTLDAAHVRALDDATAVPLGFPHDFLASPGVRALVHGDTAGRLRPRLAGAARA